MGKIYLQRKPEDNGCRRCYFLFNGGDDIDKKFCGGGKLCAAGACTVFKQVIPKRLIRSEGNEKKDNR